MKKNMMMAVCLASCAVAFGQGKDDFMRQQAYAEMQRVTGQVDVLQSNLSELQTRVGRLEGGGDSKGIRQEIDALKAAVADIRRQLQVQRGEIVKDLTGRISQMQKQQAAMAPKPVEKKEKVVLGPHKEYTVQPGDTLSMISEAFGVSIAKIKEMNNLKNDNLRVGQKLNLPK